MKKIDTSQLKRIGHAFGSRTRHEGQVLVLVALMLVALIGFVALAIDGGYLMSQRRGVQAAADGAAQAADKAYQRNEVSDITQTALDYAAESGFPASENDIVVIPHETYNGYEKCVEVEIEHDVTEFFIGAVYTGDWQVSARAVACTEPVSKPYALIALDENGNGIFGNGTASVIINDGGAMSNTEHDFCGTFDFILADGPLDAVDGIDICSNSTVVSASTNPTAGIIPDPYAHVPQPCTDPTSLPTFDDPAIVRVKNNDPEDITFQPGYYPIGIDVKGTHNITFEPGIYCFGGDFSSSAGNGTPQDYQGDDVLLFFFDPAELDLNGQGIDVDFDGIQMHNGIDYENIVVFYQREPVCHDGEFRLLGNDVQVEGAFYAKCAEIYLSGNSGSTFTGQVVGAEIEFLGGADIVINYQSDVESLIPEVYLVE